MPACVCVCVCMHIQELSSRFLMCLLLPRFCATVFQTLQEEKKRPIGETSEEEKKRFSFYFGFLTSHVSLLVEYIYLGESVIKRNKSC